MNTIKLVTLRARSGDCTLRGRYGVMAFRERFTVKR